MSDMEFKEIEYKYNAKDKKLSSFLSKMKELEQKYQGQVEMKSYKVSSWDIYYINNSTGNLARYRQSDLRPELTIKKKTNDKNNNHRVEVNLRLQVGVPQQEQESEVYNFLLIDGDGYKENFRIHKTCFIYWFGPVNYVYYIVYDEDMTEVNRFIEIEYSEEDAKHQTEEYVFEQLDKFEKELVELGISSKNRLRKSLFEMFKRVA